MQLIDEQRSVISGIPEQKLERRSFLRVQIQYLLAKLKMNLIGGSLYYRSPRTIAALRAAYVMLIDFNKLQIGTYARKYAAKLQC